MTRENVLLPVLEIEIIKDTNKKRKIGVSQLVSLSGVSICRPYALHVILAAFPLVEFHVNVSVRLLPV